MCLECVGQALSPARGGEGGLRKHPSPILAHKKCINLSTWKIIWRKRNSLAIPFYENIPLNSLVLKKSMFFRVDFSITKVPQFHTSVFCKSQHSKVKLCNQFLMNYKSLTAISDSINTEHKRNTEAQGPHCKVLSLGQMCLETFSQDKPQSQKLVLSINLNLIIKRIQPYSYTADTCLLYS